MKKKKRAEEEKFERDLVERGEAAERDREGKLPPGATHEITGRDEDGKPVVKRRRYSIK